MRRWITRIGLGLLVFILCVGIAGYWYARPLLHTATGYAAHSACAMDEFAEADADLPTNPLVPYLRVDVDDDGARATLMGLLAGQRAWYTDGYGCTLADDAPNLPPAPAVTPNELSDVRAPSASPDVEAAIAAAFGDDLDEAGRAELGTRTVVVMHEGELIGERYAEGFDAATPQLGWSMAKSITNLVVGRLAVQDLMDVGDTGLRPEWTDERAAISIDDLMRMTSGLAWDETYDLGTPITRMLYLEPDMAGYVAEQELEHPVGAYQQYSSGSTTLLCSVLMDKSGKGPELPHEELFVPLGLSSAVWEPDAVGTPVCGSYLWATPRDWVTLGQFALSDGVWEGERLLPEDWMKQSTTALPVAESDEVGYAAGWRTNLLADGALANPSLPVDTFWATGHDGQRLFVVPSADLVVLRMGFSPGVTSADLGAETLVADVLADVA